MIDHDVTSQLHSLAAMIDEPFDIAALHRRIAMQHRRRTVGKVGVAAVGVAAVVGGLAVVRDGRNGPTASSLPAATTPQPSSALPDCTVAMETQRTAPPEDGASDLDKIKAAKAAANETDNVDISFKGLVTVLTVAGDQITFHNDLPGGSPAVGTGIIDAHTRWTDGAGPVDEAPKLRAGDRIGVATTPSSDGVDHVLAIDLTAAVTVDAAQADKPVSAVVPSAEQTTKIAAAAASTPLSGPTDKSHGTVTAVAGSAVTISVDAVTNHAGAVEVVIDAAAVKFFAGAAECSPGSLAVGASVGVAFHTDAAGHLLVDDVALMP